MTTSRRLRRLPALALATLTATALLAGCSSAAEPASTAGASADGAFPVTIDSALGEAVIEAKPKRIVTIGQGSADTAVALGTTPVAVEEQVWGGDADAQQAWVREAIEKRGDALPATFTVTPEIDMDAVAEAEPDLILAPQSGITQDQFDVLSQLAPTVAYPGEAWSTAWDDQIEIIGEALGQKKDAEGLVDDIRSTLGTVGEEHPEFADLTFAYLYTGEPGTLGVFQPNEPRAAILELMGLKSDPIVAQQEVTAGTASSVLGLENADLFDDTDLVFSWFSDAEEQATIEAQPLYAQIPAVERGSDVVTYDKQFVNAASIITPLSVPWVLDEYVDLIADAATRVPR